MKQVSSFNPSSAPGLLYYAALALGFAGTLLLSPKWLVPAFAWITPAALLYFSRNAVMRRKWLILFATLFLGGLIASYEVFPMPLVVLIIFSLLDAAKNMLIYILDRKFIDTNYRFVHTLFFPAAMVAKEYIESNGGGGVWGSLANTQFNFPWLIQLASVTGLWGISFVVYWFSSMVIWAIHKKIRKENYTRGVFAYATLLAVILVYGVARYNSNQSDKLNVVRTAGLTVPTMGFLESLYEDVSGKKIKIDWKIAQSSPQLQEVNKAFIPFIENPDSANFSRSFSSLKKLHDSLFGLTQKAVSAGARIITWSEGNGLVLKSGESALLQRGMGFAKENKIYLLMAMAVIHPGKITPGKKFIENMAVLIGPGGEVLNVLHKNKPVPMIENSEPGDQLIPVIPSPAGNLSTSICYDADFPRHMRQLGDKKSDVLFLPSGDWYSIAPYHSYMAAFRGIENGCSVVRQVSGGLSMISDYRGRISLKHDFFKEGEKLWVTNAQFGHVPTVYSSIGDLLAYICLMVATICIIYILARNIRRSILKRKGPVA